MAVIALTVTHHGVHLWPSQQPLIQLHGTVLCPFHCFPASAKPVKASTDTPAPHFRISSDALHAGTSTLMIYTHRCRHSTQHGSEHRLTRSHLDALLRRRDPSSEVSLCSLEGAAAHSASVCSDESPWTTAKSTELKLLSMLATAARPSPEKGTSCSWQPSAVRTGSRGGPMLMCLS